MKKILLSSLVLGALLISPAFAADQPDTGCPVKSGCCSHCCCSGSSGCCGQGSGQK